MPYQCLSKKRRIYIRKDSAKALSDTAKIIFDFDGVLAYTSQSYRQTIIKVVNYYFLEILGLEGEKGKLATLGDIQKFKDTGLYNNDWNLSYAIITYYLGLLIRELQQKHVLQEFRKRFNGIQFFDLQNFVQILREVGTFLRKYGITATELANKKNDDTQGLESFLAQATLKNQPPVKIFEPILPQVGSDELTLIQKLIPYNLKKLDLLKRLFEESYLGKSLFKRFYGFSSVFMFNESFLEKETVISTKETLEVLRRKFGKFAIYSERPRIQGMYVLEKNDYNGYFDEKVLFFQENLVKSDLDGESVRLGKPNPTPFIELIKTFVGRASTVAYVGDGVADILLVENARSEGLANLVFLGVLSSSEYPNRLLSHYVKHETDAIVTDVNDIPYLLKSLGGKI